MHPLLVDTHATASALHDGIVQAAELRALGAGSRAVERMVAEGFLVRIRHGIYADGERWRAANGDERHRLKVRAAALVASDGTVFSHLSAAVMHGLPLIGRWPEQVHVVRPGASGGCSSRHIVAHRGGPEPEPEIRSGVLVTSVPRTVVDVASAQSFPTGVAIVDHVLRTAEKSQHGGAAVARVALLAELDTVAPRRGFGRARMAIEFGDPLAANAGESLSRARIFELGFVVPELQVCFPRVLGKDRFVDFYWRLVRKIGESDGKHKYTRSRDMSGLDPGEVVYQEKLREDALRRHVNSFDRWTWDVALRPAVFSRFLAEHDVPRATRGAR